MVVWAGTEIACERAIERVDAHDTDSGDGVSASIHTSRSTQLLTVWFPTNRVATLHVTTPDQSSKNSSTRRWVSGSW